MKINAYWKAVIAGAGPVLYAAQAVVTDGMIERGEWFTLGMAVLVALGVWRVPNASKGGATE